MKPQITPTILLVCLCLIVTINYAQVGIGTEIPNASSMLEIQSNSKGMLIPRLTSVERSGILNPADGLLVFDTTTESFWFCISNKWKELVTSETKEAQTGKVRIGDGTNNTLIDTDGSLSYEGTATRWDDLKVPMNATNRGSSNMPEWILWRQNGSSQGVWLWSFSKNVDEELYFVVQMPHAWKEGTDIFPHVHWTTKSAVSGNVKWSLEYTWSNVGESFSAPVIITSNTITKGSAATAFNHNLTSLPTITGFGKTLSSMLVCRFFRDGDDATDTIEDEVQVFEIDFHYQIDSDGSNEEFIKW